MDQPLERHEVAVAGVSLGYLERAASDESTKPPLLLLHGLVASSDSFGLLIAALVEDRRIVALDLLGAATGEVPLEDDINFAGLAMRVQQFASLVGLRRPVLLGHSHGGAVSLQIAGSHPEFARGLVLVCPAHPFSGHEERLVQFYLSAAGRVLARLLPLAPRWAHRIAFRRMLGPRSTVAAERSELYRRALRKPGTTGRLLRLLRHWRTDMQALRERMQGETLQLPVLLLWGDCDPAVPISTAEALERHLARSERINLRGIGHLPNEEAPETCARAIEAWLGKHGL